MAVTKSTTLTNAATVVYERDFMVESEGKVVWGQLVNWESKHEGQGGTSYNFGAYQDLAPAITALTEDSDVIPVVLGDTNMTITPAEYGSALSLSKMLRWSSRTNVKNDAAKLMGANRARSVDRLIRNGVLAGTNTRYPGINTVRTTLDATSDKVTMAFLLQLHADAMAGGIESFDGETFVIPAAPELIADIMQLDQYLNVQYRHPNEIFKGLPGFTFAGFRFIPTRNGKLYLGGGQTAQAATTLSDAVIKGATTVSFTSDTGVAVGDFWTIGTLEAADVEQVQIVSGSSSPWTIKGGGSGPDNLGFRYAHATLTAATEAANVAAIPIIGANSIKGVYGDDTGIYGIPTFRDNLDILGRFIYPGWYWFGGVGIWNRLVIRGECAVSLGHIGAEY